MREELSRPPKLEIVKWRGACRGLQESCGSKCGPLDEPSELCVCVCVSACPCLGVVAGALVAPAAAPLAAHFVPHLSCLLGHRWVPSAYGCAVITALGVNAAEQQPMVLNPSRTGETKKLPSVGKMGLAAGDGPYKWTFLLCIMGVRTCCPKI